MKVKLLITAMIGSETVKQGTIKDFGKETNDYLLKHEFARIFHPEDDPETIDIEELPIRFKSEYDNGDLKGQIVNPANLDDLENIPVMKKKKNENT